MPRDGRFVARSQGRWCDESYFFFRYLAGGSCAPGQLRRIYSNGSESMRIAVNAPPHKQPESMAKVLFMLDRPACGSVDQWPNIIVSFCDSRPGTSYQGSSSSDWLPGAPFAFNEGFPFLSQ